MNIQTLVVGALQTNCYLVWDSVAAEGIVIDPGGDAAHIVARIKELNIKVAYVIDTHGHFDHITANAQVVEETGAQLAVHADDAAMLTNPLRSFAILAGQLTSSPPPSLLLNEGDTVAFGGASLRVLHTPGHSPGSISLWSQEEQVVFCGDVLFRMGIGRTDFPGGNRAVLLQSIRQKLFTLPGQTVVYPGHGPQTTIEFEQQSNPFLA